MMMMIGLRLCCSFFRDSFVFFTLDFFFLIEELGMRI